MKEADAIKAFLAGDPILVVEYRSSKAEEIKWRDKETKKPMSAATLRHTVENAQGSIALSERTDDTFSIPNFKPPFAKGTRCVLRLTGLQVNRGIVSANGSLEALEK